MSVCLYPINVKTWPSSGRFASLLTFFGSLWCWIHPVVRCCQWGQLCWHCNVRQIHWGLCNSCVVSLFVLTVSSSTGGGWFIKVIVPESSSRVTHLSLMIAPPPLDLTGIPSSICVQGWTLTSSPSRSSAKLSTSPLLTGSAKKQHWLPFLNNQSSGWIADDPLLLQR